MKNQRRLQNQKNAKKQTITQITDLNNRITKARELLLSNDIDGVDSVAAATNNAVLDIAALADPKQATAAQRPARFIRIEKAVEIPDKTVRKFNDSAFGPSGLGMREILAYAPVEPDGSVKIQLPANIPFTIEILDKNARRIGPLHSSWLQVMPGETKVCTGCHAEGSKTAPSHGRTGLTTSVNAGVASGAVFPNTVNPWPAANNGATMADVRAANTCQVIDKAPCAEIPAIDVLFTDVWTDPAMRAIDAPISLLYGDLTTLPPTTNNPANKSAHCSPWDPLCRSTIHYPLHIQPLWNFKRQTLVGGAVTSDHTCVLCHNQLDAKAAFQVPAGQLDLTDTASNVDASVVTSYEELLFAHNAQALNNGVLQDLLVPAPGPPDPATGKPTTIMVPVSLAPPLAAGSAGGSVPKFLRLFDGTYVDPVQDHTGWLTPAELRLMTEWLDIGAQYYNDPFVAPAN